MSGKTYLLDTNIIINLFRAHQPTVEFVKKLNPINIPVTVVGELYYGAENSNKPEIHKNQTEAFIKECNVLMIDEGTALVYGRIKTELKKAGTPIPENDIWIGALAEQHGLTLVTSDSHFEKIETLELQPL